MKTTWKTTSVAVVLGLLGSIGAVVYAQQSGPTGTLSSPVQTGSAVNTIQTGPSSYGSRPPYVPASNFGPSNVPAMDIVGTHSATAYSIGPSGVRPGVAAKFELLTLEDEKFKIERLEGPPSAEQITAQNAAQIKLRDAERAMRSEKSSDEEKAKAKSLLRAYFSAQFQHDLEVRKEQIKQLEEQLARLRSVVDKRAASMEKIVDLRMTLLENDSNGLGFPPAFQQFAHHDVHYAPPGMPAQPALPMTVPFSNNFPGGPVYPSAMPGYYDNSLAPRPSGPSHSAPIFNNGPIPNYVPRPAGQPIPPANTMPLERKPNAGKTIEEGV